MTETSRGSRPAKSNSHLSVVLATNLQLRLESQRESYIVLRYVLPQLFFARALINSLRNSPCLYCHHRLQHLPTSHHPLLPRLPEPFHSDIEFSIAKVNSAKSINLESYPSLLASPLLHIPAGTQPSCFAQRAIKARISDSIALRLRISQESHEERRKLDEVGCKRHQTKTKQVAACFLQAPAHSSVISIKAKILHMLLL
jgi:hypothetical protein